MQYQERDTERQEANLKNPAIKTGLVYDDIYLKHHTTDLHPEKPQRLRAIMRMLRASFPAEDKEAALRQIERVDSGTALEWITTIHAPEYVKRIRSSAGDGSRYMDSVDTPISSGSYNAAVAAVGGVLGAIDAVMSGDIRNAFCAVRPPGHHAMKDKAMGFCLFNNVAVGVRYIQRKYGLSKVLIVDWDVHHGNATQDTFYDDPTVFYFSTHQYPFYPGTGAAEERGRGKGLGYNLNVPMSAGSGDKDYIEVFLKKLRPKAIQFDPDFVLISAGFDAHRADPLGGMNVTSGGFAEMTHIVKGIAEKCCEGRIVSILEGGYDLEALADSVEAHILALQK